MLVSWDFGTIHQCLKTIWPHNLPCSNKCKTSIVDYHRTCTNCSYNLCLGCCQEPSQQSSHGCFKIRSCRKRKINPLVDQLFHKQNISKQYSVGLPCPSLVYKQDRKNSEDGSIHGPSKEIGGCGDNLLNLRCVFPFNWTRELEVRAEEMLCSYHFSETPDISSCCTLCSNIYTDSGEAKLPGECPRRIGFNDISLYCPSAKDLHQETPVHFQHHWGKGHPVIVRDVLHSTTALCWDPVSMFCSYMENTCSESSKEEVMKAANCLDWCEVNILTYATDARISAEHLKRIEDLMKKYEARDLHNSQSFSNASHQKGKSSFQSEDTGESDMQDTEENISLPNGFDNVPFYSGAPAKGQTLHVESGNLSDDSESDAETSILFCGSIAKDEDSDFEGEDIDSSCSSEDKPVFAPCGALWDIFPREDVPRLLEYLRRHFMSLDLHAATQNLFITFLIRTFSLMHITS